MEDNQHHQATVAYCPYLLHHGGQPAPQGNSSLLSVSGTQWRTTSTTRQQYPTVRKVLTSGVNVGTGVGTCGSSSDLKVIMSRDHKHLKKELLGAIKHIMANKKHLTEN